jgi:hypothetical protein
MPRVLSGALVVLLAVVLLSPSLLCGQTPEQKTSAAPKASAPPSPRAIPVAEIATQATAVSGLLRTLSTKLTPSPEIESIRGLLPKVREQIDSKHSEIGKFPEEQPSLETLKMQQQLWQEMELETSGWLKVLTARAVTLKEALDQLSDLKQTWVRTRDAGQAPKAPGPVLQQVQEVLGDIASAQTPIEKERAAVLDVQSRVAQEVGRCTAALAQISQAQQTAVGGILRRDGLPIWSPELWALARSKLPFTAREVADTCEKDISDYLTGSLRGMVSHLLFLAVLMAFFGGMRSLLHRWKIEEEGGSSAITSLDFPYSAAFLGFLFCASGPQSAAPPTVKALFGILAIAPMIRLVRPMVDSRAIPGLLALWALFTTDAIRQTFVGTPLIGQSILVLETLAGVVVLGWYLLYGHLRESAVRETGSVRARTVRAVAALASLALAVALIAGATGYLRLSRILASEILAGGTMGLALYAFVRVLGGVVAFTLRVWPVRLLLMVAHHRSVLERRV